MNLKKYIYLCFFACIGLWFLLSIARTAFDFVRIIPEEKEWHGLSYDQERFKLFGNDYALIKLMKKYIANKSYIIFISKDGEAFYLSRYYLYPSNMLFVQSPIDLRNINTKKYSTIVEYPNIVSLKPYLGALVNNYSIAYRLQAKGNSKEILRLKK